jgi:ectoine hydroxylase-related dioxygenase (phytanoyl-CoA dioxygenase family)
MTGPLTEEQVAYFHEHGYLAVPDLLDPADVLALVPVYDRLFTEQAGRDTGDQFDLAGADEEGKTAALPQILNPSKHAPEIAESPVRATIVAAAEQLLGGPVSAGDHAILKPARHGAPTPWHQDEAYWPPDLEHCGLSAWIPLQPATEANGCLSFVPGSHRWDVREHRSIGGDPRVHGLEMPGFGGEGAVACPLPVGGATFHLPRTAHYAPPNHTDEPRRAYIVGCSRPGKPLPADAVPERPWQKAWATARQERAKTTGK